MGLLDDIIGEVRGTSNNGNSSIGKAGQSVRNYLGATPGTSLLDRADYLDGTSKIYKDFGKEEIKDAIKNKDFKNGIKNLGSSLNLMFGATPDMHVNRLRGIKAGTAGAAGLIGTGIIATIYNLIADDEDGQVLVQAHQEGQIDDSDLTKGLFEIQDKLESKSKAIKEIIKQAIAEEDAKEVMAARYGGRMPTTMDILGNNNYYKRKYK